jgi:hypothetical protein
MTRADARKNGRSRGEKRGGPPHGRKLAGAASMCCAQTSMCLIQSKCDFCSPQRRYFSPDFAGRRVTVLAQTRMATAQKPVAPSNPLCESTVTSPRAAVSSRNPDALQLRIFLKVNLHA